MLGIESYKELEYIGSEEIAQLFIKYYDGRIKNLRKELDNSYKQLEQAKCILLRRKSIFHTRELLALVLRYVELVLMYVELFLMKQSEVSDMFPSVGE
ncbi:hypothetical protein TNCV_2922801 [Trichonephila clavipes]|nr:hypothetical protein TNCV_2922801 [Trichonephila clavipes]